ncbi:MAG TPA: hypothetical protein VMI56_09895 [Reyranella sp.]|nr:hypothetical protein [Reyranella sp.]
MRHFTWAVTWIVVGLAVTLGTASVLSQIAAAHRIAVPTAPALQPAPASEPESTPVAKRSKDEPGRSLQIATHHRHIGDLSATSN